MERTRSMWRKVIVFLLLTAAFGAAFYYLIITGGGTDAAGGLYTLGLMWAPGAAAIVTRLVFQRNLRGFGLVPHNWRLHAVAYLLPLFYGTVVYGLVWLLGLGGFNEAAVQQFAGQVGSEGAPAAVVLPISLLLIGTVILVVAALPGALGEELGWRGLLVPELAKSLSYTQTALLSGVIWVIYHAPLILWSDYTSGAPTWYVLPMFAVTVISISFVAAWLRLRSGSVWTAVILHASHNMFILGFFDELMVDTGITNYLTTEFGAGVMLFSLLAAIVCWQRRDAVDGPVEKGPEKGLAAAGALGGD